MKKSNLICPHCSKSSITVEEINKATWLDPCICPLCKKCCNSRQLFLILIYVFLILLVEPTILFISFYFFGWKLAIFLTIVVLICGLQFYSYIETKLNPIKASCWIIEQPLTRKVRIGRLHRRCFERYMYLKWIGYTNLLGGQLQLLFFYPHFG